MNCPKCGSDQAHPKDCWDCCGTGESVWDEGDDCDVCDGTGVIEDEYECFDCAHEFVEGD